MAGLSRYPASNAFATFIDSADPIYGTGSDGDVTISVNTSLTADMYYNNLTINSGITLAPNGYRIFVKNLLTLNSSSRIGYTTGYSGIGSTYQGGAIASSVTHSLGGSASTTYTATPPTAALGNANYFKVPAQAVKGFSITASGGPTWLRGGAGGTGQSGGGLVIVSARYIIPPASGTAYISAPGTSPAGGGVVLIVSTGAVLPSGVATDVSGANPGTVNYMQLI